MKQALNWSYEGFLLQGRTNFVGLGVTSSLGQMPSHAKVSNLRKQHR